MMRIPFHKQTDPAKQAGQVKNEITLGDYLENKYPEEMKKKMTFDEWWQSLDHYVWHGDQPFEDRESAARAAWKAGQENK